MPAINFFAQEQLLVLQDWYLASGQSLEPTDATVRDDRGPLPGTFFLHVDVWMHQAHQRGDCCCADSPL